MKKHLQYLSYVIRHKWFVLVASIKIGAPIWRALVHDMSKFKPSEWFPYVEAFYGVYGYNWRDIDQYGIRKNIRVMEDFDRAWLFHQKRNPHHWQYWVLIKDNEPSLCIEMPRSYALEMIADWMGAGRAITGKWEVKEWYAKNREKIKLHDNTEDRVDLILEYLHV